MHEAPFEEHAALNSRAIVSAVVVSLTLVIIKGYAWITTGSLSLLTSLIDSSLDVLVSVVNLLAVRYAAKPADEDHRFGHTAIEDIAGLAQAVFIGASGLFIVFEAMRRLFNPQQIVHHEIGIAIIVISLLLTLALVLYQRHVSKRTASLVVEADALHYLSDFLVNGAVIFSLWLASNPQWALADPLIAVLIAAYILSSAWRIGLRAYNHLMDHEAEDETRQQIEDIIRSQSGVRGYHQLKTRRSGIKLFVQCHLEVDKTLDLEHAHAISQGVEDALEEAFPGAEVIVHKDPV